MRPSTGGALSGLGSTVVACAAALSLCIGAEPALSQEAGRDAVVLFRKGWHSADFGRWREAALLYDLAAAAADEALDGRCEPFAERKLSPYGVGRRRPFLPRYYRGRALLKLGLHEAAVTELRESARCEGLLDWAEQRAELAETLSATMEGLPEEIATVGARLEEVGGLVDDLARTRGSNLGSAGSGVVRLHERLSEARGSFENLGTGTPKQGDGQGPDDQRTEVLLHGFESAAAGYEALRDLRLELRSIESSIYREYSLLEGALDSGGASSLGAVSRRGRLAHARGIGVRLASQGPVPPAPTESSDRCRTPALESDLGPESLYGGESHALLIGIGRYKNDEWRPQSWIPGELDRLEATLSRHGFSVTRIPAKRGAKPIKETGLEELSARIREFGRTIEGARRVIVYYAGYGRSFEIAGGSQLGFLVPSDVPFVEQPADGVARNDPLVKAWFTDRREEISLDFLWRLIEAWNVPHTLVVLNAGLEGGVMPRAVAGWKPPSPRLADETKRLLCKPVRRALSWGSVEAIYAGDRHTETPKRAFFDTLIQALEGDAPVDYDQCGLFLRADSLGWMMETETRLAPARHESFGRGRTIFRLPGRQPRRCPYD